MRKVKAVKPLPNYQILVEFDNGEKRIKDIFPLLSKPVFHYLKDVDNFNSVTIVSGAVTWFDDDGDEIDLCPDSLYESSSPYEGEKWLKLSPKKNGKGYVTSYTVNIGSAEARDCGLIDNNGIPLEIEKILKTKDNSIEITLKKDN